MSKLISFIYGVINYLLFFAVFLYLIAFVGDFLVPKSVSSGEAQNLFNAIIVNISLVVLFAVQHTIMARDSFKKCLTQFIPVHIERSTFMLFTSIVLILLFYYWQPVNGVVWQVDNPALAAGIYAVFALGWLLVLISTFLTNHFDLFGLRQVYFHLTDTEYSHIPFTEMLFYKWIRHPMMLGLLIAFWSTPVMTASHLIFSVAMTIYILIGIQFEEKGLVSLLGDNYIQYQTRTSKLFPTTIGQKK